MLEVLSGSARLSSVRLDAAVYSPNVFSRKYREPQGQLQDKREIAHARLASWEVIDSRRVGTL